MKKLTAATGAPVVDNKNIQTAGLRGPALLQVPGFSRSWRISIVK
jgi:catalase